MLLLTNDCLFGGSRFLSPILRLFRLISRYLLTILYLRHQILFRFHNHRFRAYLTPLCPDLVTGPTIYLWVKHKMFIISMLINFVSFLFSFVLFLFVLLGYGIMRSHMHRIAFRFVVHYGPILICNMPFSLYFIWLLVTRPWVTGTIILFCNNFHSRFETFKTIRDYLAFCGIIVDFTLIAGPTLCSPWFNFRCPNP